jgi:hypothetical protein
MVGFAKTGIKCDNNVSAEVRAKIRKDAVAGPKPEKRVLAKAIDQPVSAAGTISNKQPRKRPVFLDDPSESHTDGADPQRLSLAKSRQDSNTSFQNLLPFRASDEDPSTSACSSDSTSAAHRLRNKKNRNYSNHARRWNFSRDAFRLPNMSGVSERWRNAWADLDCRRDNQNSGSNSRNDAMRMMADNDDSRNW